MLTVVMTICYSGDDSSEKRKKTKGENHFVDEIIQTIADDNRMKNNSALLL